MHLSGVFKFTQRIRRQNAFTLIELLVVIAILAILATVTVLVINPAQLFAQARDSRRISDLQAINSGMKFVSLQSISQGTANTVYVSIPDSNPACASLSLPTLPGGWSYACATSANYRKVDGTGWIPVNFTQLAAGAPMAALPIDPVNTVASGYYYTYTPGGSWELNAVMESTRYYESQYQDGGDNMSTFEIGSDLALSPNVSSAPTEYASCKAIKNAFSGATDGYYTINPSVPVVAYCDMTTDGGGWTRVLTLVDVGAKTNNLLNKGITFVKLRAVKASDRTVYKEATFASAQTANQGFSAAAQEANTGVMLSGPGGYGVYTSASYGQCSWGAMDMIGAGYDGSCGSESDLRVGQDTGAGPTLTSRFNVDIFVRE